MSQTEMSPGDRMAAMRTALAFQRTRMAADRTLMSVQRTSLSLIGFGFTIFSFFRSLADKKLLPEAIPSAAPARFGLTLVAEVLPPEPRLPVSLALVAALTLLLFGIFVILSLMARTGPFGA